MRTRRVRLLTRSRNVPRVTLPFPGFSSMGNSWTLVCWHRCRRFHHGDPVLHRVLHFLEGAHFNLAHALARDAELGGDLFKRDWVLGEPARLENALFAIVEHEKRRGERLAAVV